uniref:Large ribosomal subunit protein bL35m n=1 Tax=Varanus komodoensis TaxID=61221 RepID=A0A8D2LND0_VARKO
MAVLAAARRLSGVFRSFCSSVSSVYNGSCSTYPISQLFLLRSYHGQISTFSPQKPLLSLGSGSFEHSVSIMNSVTPLLQSIFHQQVRCRIQYSLRKGKRKTVKAVVKRFLRLHCGLWLRRRAGYKKKLWKKNPRRRKRLREQVFCNKTQSKLLDKMTTSFWKRRNWLDHGIVMTFHDDDDDATTTFPGELPLLLCEDG